MKQKRLDEFKLSFDDANEYPEELDYLELRLNKRIRQKNRRIVIKGFVSIAATFFLFVILVNSPTAMADAILKMPVLGTLAEYVCFDKGLQNAIKNEYATKVNLIQQDNGYALGLPYVIADSKRMVLFFQMPANSVEQDDNYLNLKIDKIIDTTTGKEIKEYTSDTNTNTPTKNEDQKGLFSINIRSMVDPIPTSVNIYVSLMKESFITEDAPTQSSLSEVYEPSTHTTIEELGSYKFQLQLPEYPKPEVQTLNKDITINGQTISINSVTEYPTGTEVSIHIPETNSYLINGLSLKAIDSDGNLWSNPGGLISSGPDNNGNIHYYLEGNYFSSASLDKILIDGIRMFKKSEADLTIDLVNQTITPAVDDLQIESITRSGAKAYITFTSNSSEGLGLFSHQYRDTKGNSYEYASESCSIIGQKVENHLAVVWPANDKVILTRSMSPMIELENPVEINFTQTNQKQ